MLTIYDYAMIVFYFAFMASVGFFFKKLNKGGDDFFAGGRKMNWWLLGASALVTNFSAWTFTGAASMAYTYGILFFSIALIDIVGFVITILWFSSRFRRLRLITAMDAVRMRFGRGNEQLFTWLQIITSYIGGAVWLVALSILLSSVFGIGQIPVIVIASCSIIILATAGGKWAVSAGDFVQTLILIGCSIGVAGLTIYHVGGFSSFISQIPSSHWEFFKPIGSIKYDWLYVTTALIWGVYQKNSIAFGAAKYIMAKDDKHARKSAFIPLIGYLVLPFFWFIPAIGALIIVPDLAEKYSSFNLPAEASYIAVCVEVLPSGMLGLMVAALFAATLSSMDSGLNINAGFLVKNFYQPVFRPKANEYELLRAGRFCTVLSGIVMMLLAILLVTRGRVSLFDAYLYLNAYVQAPLTVALFMGLLAKRTPAWSGWSSVVFGILTTVLIYDMIPTETAKAALTPFLGDSIYNYLVTNKFTFTNIITVPLTSIYFVATTLFYKKRAHNQAYMAQLDEFARRLKTPVDFEKEVGGDNTEQQARMTGTLCILYGVVISSILLVPNPLSGRIAIACCAALMLLIGGILMRKAKSLRDQSVAEYP